MPRFVVWGRIAGEPVPPEMRVGPLAVTSTVPSAFASLNSQGTVKDLKVSVHAAVSSATAHRADVAAQSDHYFWIDVDADDGITAAKTAIRDHLTPFVAALIATTGEAYYAQATWASELDSQRRIVQSTEVPIESATTIHFETTPAVQAEPVAVTAIAIHRDKHARQAAGYLVEGLRMNLRASTESDRGAAVLRLHLCTETLARTVYKKLADADLQARQAGIIAGLRDTLARAGTTSQGTKAINNASTALERERLRFLRDQIERLGDDLDLDSEIVKDAVRVATFRNQVLGHTSTKSLPREEWREWSDRARRAAAAFLHAYCQRV